MKRYLVLGFLCLLSLYGLAEYYYYRGEKVNVNVNPDSIVIYVPSKIRSSNNLANFAPVVVARNQITQFALGNENTNISSVGYIVGDSVTRKMSNCFYVKLFNDVDTTALKDVVDETNTILLGKVPHTNNWYKIMVANSIMNNSLELSNYFYETGLFADIDPGFVFEFKPNCVRDYNYLSQWALHAVNSCDTWGETTGSPYVTVAVVDQGIELSHSEFNHKSFPSSTYDCYTGISGLFPDDEPYGSHGTQVSSVIAANLNYGGMAGLAPNVNIMPISHPLDNNDWYIAEHLASGIFWAVNNDADVINCSWGDQGGDERWERLHSAMLEDAILYAINNGRRGKGCVVVFASGNKDVVDYPAYFTPEIVVCGSINDLYQRADGSGKGQALDVVAPGENIYMADLGNSYCFDNGTSFAAPHVSAIAALVLSLNADLTREEVVNIIEITTQNLISDMYPMIENRINGKWNEEIGYGLVDAYEALLAVRPKFIQSQIYYSGTEAYEYAPEITVGCAVTNLDFQGDVVLDSGCDVTMRAMNRVVLKLGFHAETGSRLHVFTDAQVKHATMTSTQSTSSPQRVAPKSSATKDGVEPSTEGVTNNGIESIVCEAILSTAIYTISGQLLQIVEGGQHDASHLPHGMYILHHRMSDGSMRSEKVTNHK